MGVTGYDIFIFLTHVKIFTKRTVGTAYIVGIGYRGIWFIKCELKKME